MSLGCHWALPLAFFVSVFVFCSAWLEDQCVWTEYKGHLFRTNQLKDTLLCNDLNQRTKGSGWKKATTLKEGKKRAEGMHHRRLASTPCFPFWVKSFHDAETLKKKKSARLTPTKGNKRHSTGMITTDVRNKPKHLKNQQKQE